MSDLLSSGTLSWLCAATLGLGIGLMVDLESRRSTWGLALSSLAVAAVLLTTPTASPFAAPTFVLIAVGTGLLRTGARYMDSPLLEGLPRWQRLVQSVVFLRRVRESSLMARREYARRQEHDPGQPSGE